MTAAFDTVDRRKLLDIMVNFVDEDDLRLTHLLLSNTSLEIRMNGNVTTEPFNSNVGSPQGDAFSGCLLAFYFETALRKLRDKLITNDIISEHSYCAQYIPPHPEEAIYADDADFISTSTTRRNKLLNIVSPTLNNENLKVNNSKTEHTILARKKDQEQETWRSTKKLGSLLGDREDIARRKQLAIAAMNEIQTVWIRSIHTGLRTRMQLYNSIVLHVLLYNCSTWGLSKTDAESIDAFHRNQLRRVLNIRWPHRISNANLYKRTKTHPISINILIARWKLLGHILRLNANTPAIKAMQYFFTEIEGAKKFRGRPRTTIVTTINNDLKNLYATNDNIINTLNFPSKLSNLQDFNKLKSIAQDRNTWQEVIKVLDKAGKANKSL